MSENIDNPIETKNIKNNLWMADLYVSRRKAYLANNEANDLESYGNGGHGARRALDIAKNVENEFMTRPDFEEIRKTDQGYQQLVEEFAMEIGSDLISRDMDPYLSPIHFLAREQSHREEAEKFRQRANKIASEHNTPGEKMEYVVFAVKSFIREVVRGGIQPNKPKASKGLTQLLSEMSELDKQKGQYMVTLGDVNMKETSSRLDALSKRLVFNVSPIAPTPSFLTPNPPDNINSMFGSPT